MEWQLEFEYLLDALAWWQISLILVATVLIGIVISICICYLIVRFVFKKRLSFFKFFYIFFSKKPEVYASVSLARQYTSTASAPPEVHEPANFPISELFLEIEHNLRIIAESSGDNQLPLQSDVWDALRNSAQDLPVNLREQLEHLYSEIHLLNQIVRVSTELGFRSSFLDERYGKRATSITEKLQKIKQSVE